MSSKQIAGLKKSPPLAKIIHGFFILFFCLGLLLSSCTKNSSDPKPPRQISFMEAQGLLNNGFAVVLGLDLPPPSELKSEDLFEVPFNKSDFLQEIQKNSIPKSKEIILYSIDTEQTEAANKILIKNGYRVGILVPQE